MSVINSMLKDLDKRQQSHDLENLNVAPVQYQAKSAPKLPWILLAIVSVLLLCGIAYSWQALSNTPRLSSASSASSPLSNVVGVTATAVNTREPEVNALALARPSPSMAEASMAKVSFSAVKTESAKAQAITSVDGSASSLPVSEQPSSAHLNVVDSDVKRVITAAAENITAPAIEPEPPAESTPVVVTPVAVKPSSMTITEVKLSNEQLALRRYRLATEAENQGLLSDAIVYYSEVLALAPVMHKARRKLAALYYGQGRLDSASDILIKGTALFPEEYDYPFLLARVQQASGDIQSAMSSLEQIPDASQLARQKWTLQSSLAQKSDNYQLAEASYRKLLRLDPEQARWWMGLAYALDSQLEYDSAKQAYIQALSADGLSKQASEYIENRLVQLGESE
ncbi:MSHA biogenesis protein MshN [Shewanella sp.]|uniref:tetratricopeptide repeat protein n=1 Tax=Shewanella sp. TaxID=50422 RepID=UPI001EBBE12F|nr:MSHA biogenesis protein MshN [Shewanella sp.]NRB22627.1 tetratricopeptide repeat protein [Shewanella sp.]